MNLISCSNCGVVLDKDVLPFNDNFYTDDDVVDDMLATWNTDRRFVWRGSYHEEIVNLRIELDERDGFIYVREKVGKVWKQRFRSTSMPHVLKTLSIMFCGVDDAVDKEKYLERTNDKNDLGPTQ